MKKYQTTISFECIGFAVASKVSEIFMKPYSVTPKKVTKVGKSTGAIIIWYVWFSNDNLISSGNIKTCYNKVEYSSVLEKFIDTWCLSKDDINYFNSNHEYMPTCVNPSNGEIYYGFPIRIGKFIKDLKGIEILNINLKRKRMTISSESEEELNVLLSQLGI